MGSRSICLLWKRVGPELKKNLNSCFKLWLTHLRLHSGYIFQWGLHVEDASLYGVCHLVNLSCRYLVLFLLSWVLTYPLLRPSPTIVSPLILQAFICAPHPCKHNLNHINMNSELTCYLCLNVVYSTFIPCSGPSCLTTSCSSTPLFKPIINLYLLKLESLLFHWIIVSGDSVASKSYHICCSPLLSGQC